jgi:hypothetical protein
MVLRLVDTVYCKKFKERLVTPKTDEYVLFLPEKLAILIIISRMYFC